MNRIVFARLPGDSRIRYSGQLPFSDSVPLSGDTRFRQLRQQFWTSGNKGNTIIGESVGRLFEMDRSRSCYLNILDLCGAGWTPGQISKAFNENFDYVVFPMANSIQPGVGHLHDKAAEIVELLETNIIVLGLGKQEALPCELSALDPSTVRLLRAFNEKARVFGVRGTETEAWLHAVKIDRARALGCPSLFVYPQHLGNVSAPVSLSATSSIVAAGHLHDPVRSRPLLSLFRRRNADYVMQDEVFQAGLENAFAPDLDCYNDVTGEFNPRVVGAVLEKLHHTRLPFQGYFYFQSPDTWRAFCATHDLYVGDRFHGGVAALQAGLPALILWGDLRVRELTDFVGLPSVSLADVGDTSLDELVARYLSPECMAHFRTTYRKKFEEFRHALEEAGLPLAVRLGSKGEDVGAFPRLSHWWKRLSCKA